MQASGANQGEAGVFVKFKSAMIWRAVNVGLVVAVGLAGLLMAHHPMLLSGFRRIQTDLGDSRFVHYMLEHGYRWVLREQGHEALWSPPFFYPVRNVGAYSDLMVGVGPVYWLWRLCGATEELAFGLWMVSMSVLNYLAGLLLFRGGLRFGWAASAGGAALVAFGAPRVNQMGHQQLLPCFYVLVAVYALTRLARLEQMHWGLRAGFWLTAALAAVAQLYSGVYLGWFLVMGTALTAAAALCLRDCRRRVAAVVWRDAGAITGAGVFAWILLRPFLNHYGEAAVELRTRVYRPVILQLQPHVTSWFSMGDRNWLWGWMTHYEWFRSQDAWGEQFLGIGILTLPICCAGLVIGWRWPVCRLAASVVCVAWLGTTQLPGDVLSLVGLLLSFYCAAGLFHEREEFAEQAKAVAVVAVVGLIDRFPHDYVQLVMLSGIVFGLLRLMQCGGGIGPSIVIAVFSFLLFPAEIIVCGAVLGLGFWMPLAYLFRERRWQIAVTLGWFVLAVVACTTLGDRPTVLVGTAVGVPVALCLTAPKRARVGPGLMLWGLAVSVPIVGLFSHSNSLWLDNSLWIPGGLGIRAIGRVVLILLIPAAVGLACVVEKLEQRQWRIVAWGLVFLCLGEQLITTDSFDVAVNQSTIAGIAGRVERNRDSFFYYRADHGLDIHDQLDAMWASLATRVATVNGYSGYYPVPWIRFAKIESKDGLTLQATLDEWEQGQGLGPRSVQLVDGLSGKGNQELIGKEQSVQTGSVQSR